MKSDEDTYLVKARDGSEQAFIPDEDTYYGYSTEHDKLTIETYQRGKIIERVEFYEPISLTISWSKE